MLSDFAPHHTPQCGAKHLKGQSFKSNKEGEKMKGKKSNGTATLIKTWTLQDGSTREKIIYQGHLKEAKKRIPPSKKDQFRIEFKK